LVKTHPGLSSILRWLGLASLKELEAILRSANAQMPGVCNVTLALVKPLFSFKSCHSTTRTKRLIRCPSCLANSATAQEPDELPPYLKLAGYLLLLLVRLTMAQQLQRSAQSWLLRFRNPDCV